MKKKKFSKSKEGNSLLSLAVSFHYLLEWHHWIPTVDFVFYCWVEDKFSSGYPTMGVRYTSDTRSLPKIFYWVLQISSRFLIDNLFSKSQISHIVTTWTCTVLHIFQRFVSWCWWGIFFAKTWRKVRSVSCSHWIPIKGQRCAEGWGRYTFRTVK